MKSANEIDIPYSNSFVVAPTGEIDTIAAPRDVTQAFCVTFQRADDLACIDRPYFDHLVCRYSRKVLLESRLHE